MTKNAKKLPRKRKTDKYVVRKGDTQADLEKSRWTNQKSN